MRRSQLTASVLRRRAVPPGRHEARGWEISLGCLGLIGLAAGTVAGLVLFGGAVLNSVDRPSGPNLLDFLVLVPLGVAALGLWTWRANLVWRFASGYAIVIGIVGVAFAVLPSAVLLLAHAVFGPSR